MNIAMYPGSFDPPTHGHFDLIRRAVCLFDHVHVVVAANPKKKPFLHPEERVSLLSSELAEVANATVSECSGLVADYANTVGARYLIRGVRNGCDLSSEIRLARGNQRLNPELKTVFFPPEIQCQSISSSILRMGLKAGIALCDFTTPRIAGYLTTASEKHRRLESRWYAVGIAVKAREGVWGRIFAELIERYERGNRAYHNLNHIGHCLNCLEEFDLPNDARSELSLAFWFHDVIVNPLRRDNERRSARLAVRRLKRAGIAEGVIQRVRELILMTKHHDSPSQDTWAKLFLDIDLAILSESEKKYEEYEAQIAQEYRYWPKAIFVRGRQRIVRQFLARDAIYQSEHFGHRESQARRNLASALGRPRVKKRRLAYADYVQKPVQENSIKK